MATVYLPDALPDVVGVQHTPWAELGSPAHALGAHPWNSVATAHLHTSRDRRARRRLAGGGGELAVHPELDGQNRRATWTLLIQSRYRWGSGSGQVARKRTLNRATVPASLPQNARFCPEKR